VNTIVSGLIGIVLMMQSSEAPVDSLPLEVRSWEGEFSLEDEGTPIRFHGLPTVYLWKYKMEGEEKGTPLAFTHEDGSALSVAVPNERGVQPVYLRHIVSINDDGSADVFVTYSIQGNGAMMMVERYAYDGEKITLKSTSMNSGKPDFEWQRLEIQKRSEEVHSPSVKSDTTKIGESKAPCYGANGENEKRARAPETANDGNAT